MRERELAVLRRRQPAARDHRQRDEQHGAAGGHRRVAAALEERQAAAALPLIAPPPGARTARASGRRRSARRTRCSTDARARAASRGARAGVRQQRPEAGRQRRRILRRAEPAVLAVDDEVEQPADGGGDQRHAAGQRLDRREAERFEMRRLHDEVGRLDQRRDVGQRADEADAVAPGRGARRTRAAGRAGVPRDARSCRARPRPAARPTAAAAATPRADRARPSRGSGVRRTGRRRGRAAGRARRASRSRSPGSAGRKCVMSIAFGRYHTRSRGTPHASVSRSMSREMQANASAPR